LLGSPTGIDFSRFGVSIGVLQVPVTSTDPLVQAASGASSSFTNVQLGLGITIGAVTLAFMLWAVLVQSASSSHAGALSSFLLKLDVLYSSNHPVATGQSPRVYPTVGGGIFSIMTLIIVALLGVLLALLNTTQIAPISTVTTSRGSGEPTGDFALTVAVYGVGLLQGACMTGSINLTLQAGTLDWLGTSLPVTYQADPTTSSCKLTWRCPACSLSASVANPQFALTSVVPSWANFYQYTFTTPPLTDATGTVLTDARAPFSVNQFLFPTNEGPDALTAFQVSYATQRVQILLTGYSVQDNRTGGRASPYTSYQPSILAVDTAVGAVAGSSGFMTAASPTGYRRALRSPLLYHATRSILPALFPHRPYST